MFDIAVNMESVQEMIDIFDTYVRTDLKLLGFAYYHPFPKHTDLKLYEQSYRACTFNLADFPGVRVKDHPEVFVFRMLAWNDPGQKPPVSSHISFFDVSGKTVGTCNALNSELYLQEVTRLFYRDDEAKKAAEAKEWSSGMQNKIFDLFCAYARIDLNLRKTTFRKQRPDMKQYTTSGYSFSSGELEMNKIPGLGMKDHPEVTKVQMLVWGDRIPPPTPFDRRCFVMTNGTPWRQFSHRMPCLIGKSWNASSCVSGLKLRRTRRTTITIPGIKHGMESLIEKPIPSIKHPQHIDMNMTMTTLDLIKCVVNSIGMTVLKIMGMNIIKSDQIP
jgi:hypothetical protein